LNYKQLGYYQGSKIKKCKPARTVDEVAPPTCCNNSCRL
jgi:hypothetical protein